MIDLAKAREFAAEWIAAWNSHDLEAILGHYADGLEFTSPLVVSRLKRPDGTIRTKSELRQYFLASVGPDSKLRFELIDVLAGVSSVTLVYRNHRDQIVAETMSQDAAGRANRVLVHHRPA